MVSAGLKFMRRKINAHGKFTERMKIFYQNLKLKLIVQKIQNHRNKWVQHGQRRTTTLNYEISTMWKTQPRMTPPKTSRLLMGQEEFTRPKSLQTK